MSAEQQHSARIGKGASVKDAGQEAGGVEPKRRSGFLVLPVAMFFGLAAMFAFALFTGDPSKIRSVLIGQPVPQFDFAPLEGLKKAGQPVPGFTARQFADGTVRVVNFWASWCVPCVQEHPYLEALHERSGVPIVGVNYKDSADDGLRFIGRHGNPYAAVGIDRQGRGAIEWGVYGTPESFVVDGAGRIAFKQIGPIVTLAQLDKMMVEIEKARAKTAAKPAS